MRPGHSFLIPMHGGSCAPMGPEPPASWDQPDAWAILDRDLVSTLQVPRCAISWCTIGRRPPRMCFGAAANLAFPCPAASKNVLGHSWLMKSARLANHLVGQFEPPSRNRSRHDLD